MSLNLAVILRESARRDPDRVAIILDSFKFTYGQLDAYHRVVCPADSRRLSIHGCDPARVVILRDDE